ncbi:MAG: leucine-rich repeat domain-containing protein [Aristaeellaceae bacterium]
MRKAWWLIWLTGVLLTLWCASGCAEEQATVMAGDYAYRVLEDGTAEIVEYYGDDEHVTIPSGLDGRTVTGIGDWAFRLCLSLESVTLPDSVTHLGINPFTDCQSLREINVSPEHPALEVVDGVLFSKADRRLVCYPLGLENMDYTVPEGVESIGGYAFFRCMGLGEITLPDSLKSIGTYAFFRCNGLKSIDLPEGLTSLGDYAFHWCASLESITLPDSLTQMGENPFVSCSSLREIKVSADNPALAVMDGVLFSKEDKRLICYLLTLPGESYEVPQGIRIIGGSAFAGCDTLVSITLPDSLRSIGDAAFSGCDSLAGIRVPEGVTSIGEGAFQSCGSFAGIELPDTLTSIGEGAFADCEALVSITLPDSVTSLGAYVFASCMRLKHVVLPSGLTDIGSQMFDRCWALESIILPDGVEHIGDCAFGDCWALESVNLPAGLTSIGEDAFAGCDSLTLTVPRDSYACQYARDNGIPYMYPDSLDWLND